MICAEYFVPRLHVQAFRNYVDCVRWVHGENQIIGTAVDEPSEGFLGALQLLVPLIYEEINGVPFQGQLPFLVIFKYWFGASPKRSMI